MTKYRPPYQYPSYRKKGNRRYRRKPQEPGWLETASFLAKSAFALTIAGLAIFSIADEVKTNRTFAFLMSDGVDRSQDRYFANCDEARAAGVAPMYRLEPGYRPGLDGDNDGKACEPYRP